MSKNIILDDIHNLQEQEKEQNNLDDQNAESDYQAPSDPSV